MSDDQSFRAVWLIALLLMVLAAAISLAGRLRQSATWMLIGGFLFFFYRVAEDFRGEWLREETSLPRCGF